MEHPKIYCELIVKRYSRVTGGIKNEKTSCRFACIDDGFKWLFK